MGDGSLYDRRVEQERRILQCLVSQNPAVLEIVEHRTEGGICDIVITLRRTQGLIVVNEYVTISDVHTVRLHFPRFFPSVPVEGIVCRPVFHPNVHPETGFVCLWARHSLRHCVVEAVGQLQRVITWTVVNEELNNVMQPEAMAWRCQPDRAIELPLAFQRVEEPRNLKMERTYLPGPPVPYRRRLQ